MSSKANYNLLSTTVYHATPATANQLLTVPITTPSIVPAGHKLLLELYHGTLQSVGSFGIYTNNDGSETAPSYDFSPSCGDTTPGSYGSFGFGVKKLIIFGTGRQSKQKNNNNNDNSRRNTCTVD